MPVLFARSEPHHVSRPDVLDWASFTLHPTGPRNHDQGLPEGMGMPGRPSARLEGHLTPGHTSGFRGSKQWIDTNRACEPLCWAFLGGLSSSFFDFHTFLL